LLDTLSLHDALPIFRGGSFVGNGGELAFGPNGPVFKVLLLPNGHRALEGVDGEAAGVKGRVAMRSADGDEDACVPDFEPSKAVEDRKSTRLNSSHEG